MTGQWPSGRPRAATENDMVGLMCNLQWLRIAAGIAAATGTVAAAPHCFAADSVASPLSRPAVMTGLAAHATLLSVTRAGSRMVAVGERGIVILSDDDGGNWRQAKVPVSVTLTAVAFPTERQGWAVGHYGVVLHSADGGETWTRQLDGNTAARMYRDTALAKAATLDREVPLTARIVSDGERMLAEGADKPFFDLHFEDAKRGFVVGAYNLAFRTEDGGKNWRCVSHQIDNARSLHLYAVAAQGDAVYIAGEQGLVLRSLDGGTSFTTLSTPYDGSFFRLAPLRTGDIVLAGLRGNAWRSTDRGDTWRKIEAQTAATFTAATVTDAGVPYLADQAGRIFASRDQGETLAALPTPPMPPLSDLTVLPDGTLIATSMRGILRIPPATPARIGEERPL